MARTRQIALLIESSREFGRGLLRGIAQYAREHPGWATHFRPHGLGEPPLSWISRWRGDGILARIENEPTARAVLRPGVPVVDLRGTLSARLRLPAVLVDDTRIAQLAAQHLLDRGFRHFGYCSWRRGYHPGVDRRGDLFQRFLEQAGFTCHTLAAFEPYLGRFQSPGWERQQRQIGKWVASLPKPVGVLACNDDRGLELLDACREVSAAVPDSVAVIGVDNDECVGTLSIPPLTSIDSNAQRVGYEAAGLLDSLIDGRKPPSRPRYVHPLGIVTRQSTDVMAIDDREIVAALRFIRQNACRQIRIADVIKQAGSSRASLESGLKKNLGRTIHQEIQRVRLERALDLLTATNLPIKRIAFETGFQTVQYLTRVFRKTMGAPPARYRRRCQLELRSARSPS